jgi:uncharacterized membrane protein YphA (DoxX/SURF4 family)
LSTLHRNWFPRWNPDSRFFHAPSNFFPANNGGDAAILYCLLFLLFVFTGPGKFAIGKK